MSKSRRTIIAVAPFDHKYMTSYQMAIVKLHFFSCQNRQFENFDRENLRQGQGVQHSQWTHLMANINLYKNHT